MAVVPFGSQRGHRRPTPAPLGSTGAPRRCAALARTPLTRLPLPCTPPAPPGCGGGSPTSDGCWATLEAHGRAGRPREAQTHRVITAVKVMRTKPPDRGAVGIDDSN